MPKVEYFELRRQIDGLIYQFDRLSLENGGYGYKRRDSDFWIINDGSKGWIAVDPITGDIAGRPWFIPPEDQIGCPPEGDWVSKKGVKSYVYQLVHAEKPE